MGIGLGLGFAMGVGMGMGLRVGDEERKRRDTPLGRSDHSTPRLNRFYRRLQHKPHDLENGRNSEGPATTEERDQSVSNSNTWEGSLSCGTEGIGSKPSTEPSNVPSVS
ncbi:hypothetical protein K469DRAFT_719458 [Zopfia rhizophila CBS 207.26]|uniref:Uncharacterized protein n=1 Tax=Zopfia rhizophila CBS 207.26 TaxID=1314779 RepID=A0A6A6DH63_9PEZI|nr:hypothetical protein K469DRAFT_719458 [Zopfia rhizophila CBS 207.26]